MVHVISVRNAHLYEDAINSCHKLRHRVFVDERGWNDLRQADGHEVDQFDTDIAIHLAELEGDLAIGYFRLIPSKYPHLLSEVHSFLCGDEKVPRGPDIIESTRLCVAPERRGGRAINLTTGRLLIASIEYALLHGFTKISGECHPAMVSMFLGLGLNVMPLGLPQRLENELTVAVTVEADLQSLERIRETFDIVGSVLENRVGVPDLDIDTTGGPEIFDLSAIGTQPNRH